MGQLRRQRLHLALGFGKLALGLLKRHLGVLELLDPRPATLGVPEHLLDRTAVLALQPGQERQALLDFLQPGGAVALGLGLSFQFSHIGPELVPQLLGLIAKRVQPC